MIEQEKTVLLSLTPEEYEVRTKVVADYMSSQFRHYGWCSNEYLNLKRYQFDANYNLYYVKLKFVKNPF